MARRAPHSPQRSTGWLPGWRLTFGGEDRGWEGALATIVEDADSHVFVALYDVAEAAITACSTSGRAPIWGSTARSACACLPSWRRPCLGLRARRIRGRPAVRALSRVVADAAEKAGAPDDYVPPFALDPAVRSANGTLACPKGSAQARVRSMGDEQREDPYARARTAGETLRERTGGQLYDVALVMGSGWVPAADVLGTADHEIKTTELPGFPPAAVAGHAGAIRSIAVAGQRAAGVRRPHSFVRRAWRRRGCPRCTDGTRRRLPYGRPDQRGGRPEESGRSASLS